MSDGGFSNPITGGQGALVRPAIKSPNYVPGVSGWSINRDGSAEFADLRLHFNGNFGRMELVDGEIRFFDLNNVLRIRLTVDGTGTNAPSIELYDAAGQLRAQFTSEGNAAAPSLLLFDVGGITVARMDADGQYSPGAPELRVTHPVSAAFLALVADDLGNPDGTAQAIFQPPSPTPGALLTLVPGVGSASSVADIPLWRMVSPAEVGGFLQSLLELKGGTSLDAATRATLAATLIEIQAADLVSMSSPVTNPNMRPIRDVTGALVSTTSTAYVSLPGVGAGLPRITQPYPRSGAVEITIAAQLSNSLAGEAAFMGFEIRDTNDVGVVRQAANFGADCLFSRQTVGARYGITVPVFGLPATGTMFVRAMYASSVVGNTANFTNRSLTMTPLT